MHGDDHGELRSGSDADDDLFVIEWLHNGQSRHGVPDRSSDKHPIGPVDVVVRSYKSAKPWLVSDWSVTTVRDRGDAVRPTATESRPTIRDVVEMLAPTPFPWSTDAVGDLPLGEPRIWDPNGIGELAAGDLILGINLALRSRTPWSPSLPRRRSRRWR